jgi:hypothetical protein
LGDCPWSPLLVAAPLAAALASVPLGRRAALLLWALVPVTGALAALVVAQVWSHSRHAVPEVPEGDLVVIGEAIVSTPE